MIHNINLTQFRTTSFVKITLYESSIVVKIIDSECNSITFLTKKTNLKDIR